MVSPRSFLPQESMPWSRHIEETLEKIARLQAVISQESSNSFRVNAATMSRIQQQLTELDAQALVLNTQSAELSTQAGQLSAMTTNLTNVTNYLSSLGVIRNAEAGSTGSFSSWFTGARPSVTIASPTGRVQLIIAHTVNPGSELSTTYTASGGLNQTRQTNFNSNVRVIKTVGGNSTASTSSLTMFADVTPNVNTVFTLEHFGQASGTIVGRTIMARVLP